MSYYGMDHAEWMERNLPWDSKHKNAPEKLSDFQKAVVDIVGIVGNGIHNAPTGKWDWNYGGGVSLMWKQELSSWDFSNLTRLVVLCHIARIRVQIEPVNMRNLRLSFWERSDSDLIMYGHPTISDAVDRIQAALPKDSRIRYENRNKG